MIMKSLALTAILAVVVAYAGSFLTVWKLPHQQDPYTFHDMKRGVAKMFSFTDDLREARTSHRQDNENLFAHQVGSFNGPE